MFLLVMLCFASASAFAAEGNVCNAAAQLDAVRLLRSKIRALGLYSEMNDQCLIVRAEDCNSRNIDLVVQENHTNDCGGDPATAPVLDRFRVLRRSKKVEWYSADGEYVGISKARAIDHR